MNRDKSRRESAIVFALCCVLLVAVLFVCAVVKAVSFVAPGG